MLPNHFRSIRALTARLWVVGVLLFCLLWVYWPTLSELVVRWGNDSNYSHGYFVPLFSLYLLWSRRAQLRGPPTMGSIRWGLPIMLVGLALSAIGAYLFVDWFNAMAMLPCLAGLVVLVGGWQALGWAWPAIAFLAFMVPLPFVLEVGLAQPLQRVCTQASTYALQTLGFAAFAEGNVIRMGQVRIGVVEACNGLSMLVVFFALSTAVAILVRRPWWQRLLLAASAAPIALAANITRITVTGALHKLVGQEPADFVFHDLAGWLMTPLAVAMLWAEMRLLSWVIVIHEAQGVSTALGRLLEDSPPISSPFPLSPPATLVDFLANEAARLQEGPSLVPPPPPRSAPAALVNFVANEAATRPGALE